MHITTIGRGRVGGGLARRWGKAGHTVTQLGRDGGDAADADVVLVAVPSGPSPTRSPTGYDPVYVGGLERARALEEHLLGMYSTLFGFFRPAGPAGPARPRDRAGGHRGRPGTRFLLMTGQPYGEAPNLQRAVRGLAR